jgi:hypothetical protein
MEHRLNADSGFKGAVSNPLIWPKETTIFGRIKE